MDPEHLTLRELVWMNEGRDRVAWSIVSEVLAVMANLLSSSKRARRFHGSDFNPYRIREVEAAPVGIDVLRHVFIERKPL